MKREMQEHMKAQSKLKQTIIALFFGKINRLNVYLFRTLLCYYNIFFAQNIRLPYRSQKYRERTHTKFTTLRAKKNGGHCENCSQTGELGSLGVQCLMPSYWKHIQT